jgi:leucyl-tRNA synthetase
MTERPYNPAEIEAKWQQRWEETQLYRSRVDWSKPKHYALTMLPYPSGDLHIGHWFAMTPSDARARYMRMKGYNVLFPMGFDAFGLPAEQAAISRNIHPWKWTYQNIQRMRAQLKSMGNMFDWEREIISSVPEYYKWTEWFFKLFYENDLAYRGEALVNWSEALQTVLANEQVVDGKDERLGQPVIQKMMTQWFFRYTRYADEMLDFSQLDWPEPIRNSQTNWIGRSEGAKVTFKALTSAGEEPLVVFTTRPDTLWGATFMVLAPEHPLVDALTTAEQRAAVEAYKAATARATEIERMSTEREKTGVFTGGYAVNPVNQKRIPVWIADYVMISYGTGAIMAVPAGDQRDFEFARKFGLEVVPVIQPSDQPPLDGETMTEAWEGPGVVINSDWLNGTLSNGEKGRKNPAIAAVIDWLEAQGIGSETINYRLRDWLISRQRYWGSPIPIVYDPEGQPHAVPDEELPVELPEDVDFMPTGRSPLTYHEPFYRYHREGWRRETDTMDTFMCSSWYHLRYLSPHYDRGPFDPEEAAYWLPVDTYTGGAEHATMHLLYARWFNKAIRDLGVFDEAKKIAAAHGRSVEGLFDEPYLQLRNQGQVLGGKRTGDYVVCRGCREDSKLYADHVEVIAPIDAPTEDDPNVVHGELMKRVENTLFVGEAMQLVELTPGGTVSIPSIPGENNVNQLKHHLEVMRMSKSKGNVVNPDELVQKYGADTVRAHLMFAFDWQTGGPWDEANVVGVTRWLDDTWALVRSDVPPAGDPAAERDLIRAAHQMIERVSDSLERFSFNTAVSGLMTFRNALKAALRDGKIGRAVFEEVVSIYLRCMAPITPHIAEELWEYMGWPYSVHTQPFPEYDPEKAKSDMVELVVMINGKPREKLLVPAGTDEAQAEALALASEAVQRHLNGGAPKRIVHVPSRLGQELKVNLVL